MNDFSADVLNLDPEKETKFIVTGIRNALRNDLKRRGIVVGISGGIDSSVTATLAVKAIGKERVLGLELPELHSAKETLDLSGSVIKHLGIKSLRIDISPVLQAVGAYRHYDNAVRMVIPNYSEGWKSKMVISNIFDNKGFSFFSLIAQDPDGSIFKKRLPLKPYLEIVAATNFKQRTRKMLEYYHADRLNFVVAGTPNRLEYDQGFFVKIGDGAADVKPIAHLYKSQVYQLADYLEIPEEICARLPTTDTYSMLQGQDEFYFSLPYHQMDICLYAKNHGIVPEAAASASGLSPEQVKRVYEDIDTKRSTTRYLHLKAITMQKIPEINGQQ
jgi:NAD+ synthase